LCIVVAVRAVDETGYLAADAVTFGGIAVALELVRRRIQSWRFVERNEAATQKARLWGKEVVVGRPVAE
jgi:hypothetical protein